MELHERIKQRRIETGFTQQQAADALETDRSNYAGYESGRRVPPPDKLKKMADLFNVSVDYLLGRSVVRRPDEIAAASGTSYDDLPPEAIEELNKYRELLKLKYGKEK